MSQEKVNRYKEYKAHRKEILAKEKRKKLIARITGWTLLALVVVGIAGGIGSVSYTHLDVYKRQFQPYP